MDELDLNLYVLAELNYKKLFGDSENLFPPEWYSSKNYKLKTEIIAEAIKKKIRVEETELYKDNMIEGIRD